jgi:hypothetical protein
VDDGQFFLITIDWQDAIDFVRSKFHRDVKPIRGFRYQSFCVNMSAGYTQLELQPSFELGAKIRRQRERAILSRSRMFRIVITNIGNVKRTRLAACGGEDSFVCSREICLN